ncbi:MAG: hypothetical protein KA731_00580 [Candidatus Moranbacteria bacterium]|nr:hypothetical protein [Candidatus Moranbacteria bacterium]MBP6033914.1 hypothetical protein [Candidatus Moranbacteria bacterium]MBP7695627.1 hypothetical protein [Candidatus Moranbacteria bacterium]
MSSELECTLRDKVITDLAKGLAFKTAFADAAHQHRIFHSDPAQRATYNYLYRAVERRVKRTLGTDASLWATNAQKQLRHETSLASVEPKPSDRRPAHRHAFIGQMAAAGERPEDYD